MDAQGPSPRFAKLAQTGACRLHNTPPPLKIGKKPGKMVLASGGS